MSIAAGERPDLVSLCLPNEGHFEPTPPIHARAGRRAHALAHAIIRSFETGTRVATP